jgi:Mg/Co/Ni transporter MgtE
MAIEEYQKLLSLGEYSGLKSILLDCDLPALAGFWTSFKPVDKLTLFKLLEPQRALQLFSQLDFDEKYFILCGHDLNSIAPVLEPLSPSQRRLFVELPAVYYDRMLQMMVGEQIEITLSSPNN